jgi:uncharacterized protein YndB with AHSA1/START domain
MTKPMLFTYTRTYNFPIQTIWEALSEMHELLQWWSPKNLSLVDASLDFRLGGQFHYGMQTPEGQEMWGKFIYREIEEEKRISFLSFFSDREGRVTRHPVSPKWPAEMLNEIRLTAKESSTELQFLAMPFEAQEEEIITFNQSAHLLEKGFAHTFEQLQNWLQQKNTLEN